MKVQVLPTQMKEVNEFGGVWSKGAYIPGPAEVVVDIPTVLVEPVVTVKKTKNSKPVTEIKNSETNPYGVWVGSVFIPNKEPAPHISWKIPTRVRWVKIKQRFWRKHGWNARKAGRPYHKVGDQFSQTPRFKRVVVEWRPRTALYAGYIIPHVRLNRRSRRLLVHRRNALVLAGKSRKSFVLRKHYLVRLFRKHATTKKIARRKKVQTMATFQRKVKAKKKAKKKVQLKKHLHKQLKHRLQQTKNLKHKLQQMKKLKPWQWAAYLPAKKVFKGGRWQHVFKKQARQLREIPPWLKKRYFFLTGWRKPNRKRQLSWARRISRQSLGGSLISRRKKWWANRYKLPKLMRTGGKTVWKQYTKAAKSWKRRAAYAVHLNYYLKKRGGHYNNNFAIVKSVPQKGWRSTFNRQKSKKVWYYLGLRESSYVRFFYKPKARRISSKLVLVKSKRRLKVRRGKFSNVHFFVKRKKLNRSLKKKHKLFRGSALPSSSKLSGLTRGFLNVLYGRRVRTFSIIKLRKKTLMESRRWRRRRYWKTEYKKVLGAKKHAFWGFGVAKHLVMRSWKSRRRGLPKVIKQSAPSLKYWWKRFFITQRLLRRRGQFQALVVKAGVSRVASLMRLSTFGGLRILPIAKKVLKLNDFNVLEEDASPDQMLEFIGAQLYESYYKNIGSVEAVVEASPDVEEPGEGAIFMSTFMVYLRALKIFFAKKHAPLFRSNKPFSTGFSYLYEFLKLSGQYLVWELQYEPRDYAWSLENNHKRLFVREKKDLFKLKILFGRLFRWIYNTSNVTYLWGKLCRRALGQVATTASSLFYRKAVKYRFRALLS